MAHLKEKHKNEIHNSQIMNQINHQIIELKIKELNSLKKKNVEVIGEIKVDGKLLQELIKLEN